MKTTPRRLCTIAALIAAIPGFGVSGALAQDIPEDLIRAEILGGWRTESGTQMAALHLSLADGWKTYWRAPGAAGIPPQFDWTGSTNVASVAYHWPRPQIFDLNGLRTLAYKDELVLPIEFTPHTPGAPVSVSARIDLGICENVCVPVSIEVSGDLATGMDPDPVIRSALAAAPRSARAAGIPAPRCSAAPIRDGLRLTTEIALPGAAPGDFAVVELADASVWVSPVETRTSSGQLVDVSDLVPATALPFALDRSGVRITVFSQGGEVMEFLGCAG